MPDSFIFKEDDQKTSDFSINEFLFNYRYIFLFLLIGLTLVGGGILVFRQKPQNNNIEILSSSDEISGEEIVVEVSGEVQSPGVYQLPNNSRVNDALIAAGGISSNADRDWIQKTINMAAKLTDGQKIYIPSLDNQSQTSSANNSSGYQNTSLDFTDQGSGLVDINTASLSQRDTLPGIGPVYGQKIIDQRPYSTVEELLSKEVLGQSLYEKIKDKVSIY